MGSNPTPSECYNHNDLRSSEKTLVTSETPRRNYQQLNFNSRGGYDLTADAYVWHPDPNVRSMLFAQHRGAK